MSMHDHKQKIQQKERKKIKIIKQVVIKMNKIENLKNE